MAVDPKNENVLWAASIGEVVTSSDGGQTWSQPHPGLPGLVRALAFDPFNSQILYAGVDTGGSPPSGIYRSLNGGATWALSSTGLSRSVGVLAVDRNTPGTVYVAPFNASVAPVVYKSTDNGGSWAPAATGLGAQWINAMVVDPTDSRVLYAGGYGSPAGLNKSTDGGQAWQPVGALVGTALSFAVAVDPVVPSNVFVSRDSATGAPARSVDGGATWEDLPVAQVAVPLTNLMVLDPLKPSVVLATDDSYGLVEFEVAPDLEVALPTVPSMVALGGSDSITIRVTNRGPLAASAVRLRLTPPASMTAATGNPGQGTCARIGAALECSLGAVRVNQVVDTQLAFTAGNASDQGTLAVSLAGHESDPADGNNALTTPVVTDRVSNVGVTLSSSVVTVDPQGPLILTATATNGGPNPSSDTQVVIQLGSGITYQAATPSQGACTVAGSTITCTIGAIAVGAQATMALTGTATGSGTLAPAAQVSTAGVDPVTSNNAATASVSVNVPPSPSSSSGGGGASGVVEWLGLLSLLVVYARSRRTGSGARGGALAALSPASASSARRAASAAQTIG
jgi:hypothetical protein